MLGSAARTNIGLRLAAWFALTLAATLFWLSRTPTLGDGHHAALGFLRFFGAPLGIGLLLGWALGLVGRGASWPLRLVIAVTSAAMPAVFILFMLFFGCAVWNSMAGGYRCGL